MKNTIFTIVVVFVLTNLTYSQKLKNEFYGLYGYGTAQEISGVFNAITILPYISDDFSVKGTAGPIAAGYKHTFGDHFSLGIQYSYSSFELEFTTLNTKFAVSNKFTALMLQTSYYYNPNSFVQLYSGISAGPSYYEQKDSTGTYNRTIGAFQVNLIGARFGSYVGAFVELGFGYNGIITGGVSVKF